MYAHNRCACKETMVCDLCLNTEIANSNFLYKEIMMAIICMQFCNQFKDEEKNNELTSQN